MNNNPNRSRISAENLCNQDWVSLWRLSARPMFGSPWSPCFLKDLRHHIHNQIALGFLSKDDIPKETIAVYGGLLEELVSVLTAEIFLEQVQEEKRWPAITDFDRLVVAFSELETEGIVCCHGAGATVADAIEIAMANLREESTGYAFYTVPDAITALANQSLRIGFGVNEKRVPRPPAAGIAQAVVRALQRHSFGVQWNGNIDSCIQVTLDWKRRWLTSRAPKGKP